MDGPVYGSGRMQARGSPQADDYHQSSRDVTRHQHREERPQYGAQNEQDSCTSEARIQRRQWAWVALLCIGGLACSSSFRYDLLYPGRHTFMRFNIRHAFVAMHAAPQRLAVDS